MAAPHPAGSWRLAHGHAVSLRPCRAGWLAVARGSVWLTVSGPGAVAEDRVLLAGHGLRLLPGQHAVVEPWAQGGERGDAAFRWSEQPVATARRRHAWAGEVEPAGQALATALRATLQSHVAVARAVIGLGQALASWMALRASVKVAGCAVTSPCDARHGH
ncbi:DUF2917 domain-containing protein [Acidovorax sp. GBBC 3334]|uniref:DUF2917 domain-containing protein n=1 Tax=Acidovorax sp. GBBC 3334 TaxID=2940496 RepID=UPI002304B98D|nr:DUF2917 domain-containing protein [Acidovorax sp. GBBC 3334]